MSLSLLLLLLLVACTAVAVSTSCTSDLDCSLNGVCTSGSCVCDKPWSGQGCEKMNFKPVTFPQGYGMAPNLTSWGGGAIYDPGTKKYHAYISVMTNDCLLKDWGAGMRVDHAVADTVTGPYKFVDVAVPVPSPNAAPIRLHDGTYAIIHIMSGNGSPNGGPNCTCQMFGNCPPPPPPPPCPAADQIPGYKCYKDACASDQPCHSAACNCGNDLAEPKLTCSGQRSCAAAAAAACATQPGCELFTIYGGSAKLFDNKSIPVPEIKGTWAAYVKTGSAAHQNFETMQQTQKAQDAQDAQRALMPAVASAGSTIHVAKSLEGPFAPLSSNTLGSCNNPAPWVHRNGTIFIVCGGELKRAEHISGPWQHVSSFSTTGGPKGAYEDPYLYVDARNRFHLIYHVYESIPAYTCVNSTVSAHVFSPDGFTWHAHPVSPYGTQVMLSTGETITVSTRERPKLFFDDTGQMTHLFNGVCSATACPPPNGPKTGCVDCKYEAWDYTLVAPLDV